MGRLNELGGEQKRVGGAEGGDELELRHGWLILYYFIKIKIHPSCEVETFVETRLFKLGVILRSRVLLGVCPH